jgi:glutamate--cysteine ligase
VDWQGRTEAFFLDGLDTIVESGVTAADALLEKYHRAWNGDVDKVFDEHAY